MTLRIRQQWREKRQQLLISAILLVVQTLSAQVFVQAAAPTPADRVANYLVRSKARVAIASFTVGADGQPDLDDPAILHAIDRSMPLGSSIKILLAGTYADAVERGQIDPQESIQVREWERYYMPDTDGGAHAAALDTLGLDSDEYGFALDQAAELTLEQLTGLMIRHSDNAAFDYLLRRLGRDAVVDLIRRAGLVAQQAPISDLGELLARSNHQIGNLDARRVAELGAMSRAQLETETDSWRERFLDPAWREAEFAWRLAGNANESYIQQAAVLAHTDTQGTAGEFAALMCSIAQERFVSPRTSRHLASILAWPLEAFPGADQVFERWGAKGGSIPGVLTDNNFTIAKLGDFSGRLRITVVFLDRLGQTAWQRLKSTDLFQFEQRLMSDAAFVEKLAKRLER